MTNPGWYRFRGDVMGAIEAGVPSQLARRTWTSERLYQVQRDSLGQLLHHAVECSPFHRRRLATIDITDPDPLDLSALPVMTKSDMMAELDNVFTDRRLNRDNVENALAATGPEPTVLFDEYVALASGGSSGNRGVFVYDEAAMTSFAAAIYRPPIEAPLDSLVITPHIAMVTASSAVHATGIAVALAAGPDAPAHVESIPATLPIGDIVEQLNGAQPSILGGYASMLARLAAESRAGRLRIEPLQVSSTSETLHPDMRAEIRASFGVPVLDGFGSTEGLFGKTGPDLDEFVFNTDMCIVELVDEDNRPVPPGTPSAKVLLTNLYNLIQPLIRYELSDTFIQQPGAAGHSHLRALVRGRSDEILRYPVTDIHPITIRSVMVQTPYVSEYQVRQTHCGIDVLAVCCGELDRQTLTDRLSCALNVAGLPQPTVTVQLVERLARHPVTGKLRGFIPL